MEWEQSQIERFSTVLERDISNLLRESSTEFNFLEIKPKVEKVAEALQSLKENSEFWLELPQSHRDELNTKIDQIAGVYNEMQSFDPKQPNAWDHRNNLINSFESQYREFYMYLIERLNAFLGQKAYAKELSSKFGQEAKTELEEIRKVRSQIQKIQKDVQEASTIAGDTASTATAHSFDEQAIEHKDIAKMWLKGICVAGGLVGLITLVFSLMIVVNWSGFKSLLENSPLITIKLVVLAISLIGLKFCIKNYSAHQHLYVINRHRANSLKAMEAFRTSAIDDSAKDAILLAAVGAAYAHTESGFITTKEGAGSDTDELLEIIKMASIKK